MWDLDQNPGAVTSLRIAAASSAVREANQDLDALLDNFVALMAADARNKAHPACIVLACGIVQPLGRGQSVRDGGGPYHGLLLATRRSKKYAVLCYKPLRSSSEMGRHLLWYSLESSKVQFRISIVEMKISAADVSASPVRR